MSRPVPDSLLIRDDPEALDLLDRATKQKHGGDRKSEPIKSANVRLDDDTSRKAGNTRQYALRRLRKDAPEVHARVLAGELSAHAGMVAAGFRRAPTALQALQKAWAKATREERASVLLANANALDALDYCWSFANSGERLAFLSRVVAPARPADSAQAGES